MSMDPMFNIAPTKIEFRAGDRVVLAEGPYRGTPGVFVALRNDVNWAEIRERHDIIRCHPVRWLQLAAQPPATAPETNPAR